VLGDGRSTSRLIKLLRTDRYAETRRMAAYALGLIGSPRAIRALREALANTTEAGAVRGMAAEHLVHENSAIPDLMTGLRDASREVRFWSAYALGEGRVNAALPALHNLAARDRSRVRGWWSVAREARWAIATIEGGWTESQEP
jgi:HEAT repeat protein